MRVPASDEAMQLHGCFEYAERHGNRCAGREFDIIIMWEAYTWLEKEKRDPSWAVWRMCALNRVTMYDRPKVWVRLILRANYTPENTVPRLHSAFWRPRRHRKWASASSHAMTITLYQVKFAEVSNWSRRSVAQSINLGARMRTNRHNFNLVRHLSLSPPFIFLDPIGCITCTCATKYRTSARDAHTDKSRASVTVYACQSRAIIASYAWSWACIFARMRTLQWYMHID